MSSSSSSNWVRVTFLIAISWRKRSRMCQNQNLFRHKVFFNMSTNESSTSPLALIRVVWNRSPEPQEGWLFHSRSEGGLWAPPEPALQIWSPHKRRNETSETVNVLTCCSAELLTVTLWPAFRVNLAGNLKMMGAPDPTCRFTCQFPKFWSWQSKMINNSARIMILIGFTFTLSPHLLCCWVGRISPPGPPRPRWPGRWLRPAGWCGCGPRFLLRSWRPRCRCRWGGAFWQASSERCSGRIGSELLM